MAVLLDISGGEQAMDTGIKGATVWGRPRARKPHRRTVRVNCGVKCKMSDVDETYVPIDDGTSSPFLSSRDLICSVNFFVCVDTATANSTKHFKKNKKSHIYRNIYSIINLFKYVYFFRLYLLNKPKKSCFDKIQSLNYETH
jgi:hypothetical protein